nr:general stress protein [Chromohalobacter salexigens]
MSVNEAGQKGGKANAETHDREHFEEIGSKGGKNSGGNFANDPEKASEAGKKGGQNSNSGGRNS